MLRSFLFSLFVAIIVWIVWIGTLSADVAFSAIRDYWQVSVTMIFGSFIAGATSEGGGAVAFPVFTKLLHVDPFDAKVFSLAIQSVGMTAATLVIIKMRVIVDWRVIFWASTGGVFGILFSSIYIAPHLPPAIIKMAFTVLVSSFALTLFVLNRHTLRLVNKNLPETGRRANIILLGVGLIGGIVSGMVGNGIDIITFSVLVLWYRMDEKVATPTSVILMAFNAIVGFAIHTTIIDGFNETVEYYWYAAIPIVVIGAPLGAMACSVLDRTMIARVLLILIAIELITSLILIPMTFDVVLSSIVVFVIFTSFYYIMYRSKTYEPPVV